MTSIYPIYRRRAHSSTAKAVVFCLRPHKGATRAQLLVDIENMPAVGYYSHLGWESTQLQARRIFL